MEQSLPLALEISEAGSFIENMFRFFSFLVIVLGSGIFFMSFSYAYPQTSSNDVLCTPKIEAQVRLAFSLFWYENEAYIRAKIGQTVCSGSNGAAPMPAREVVNSLLGFSPSARDERATECYNCFGRMFIARSLDVRDEMELCLDKADCRKGLCPDQPGTDQTSPANAQTTVDEAPAGRPRALHDVYDDNARDLMAIP